MEKTIVGTSHIAPPVGPYSQAVRCGDTVYVSGQIAQDPATGRLIGGGVSRQTEQIFRNAEALLQAAGMTLSNVVRVGVYLADMRDFQAVNMVYVRYFESPYPARTTVAVAALPLGAAIEMEMIARD